MKKSKKQPRFISTMDDLDATVRGPRTPRRSSPMLPHRRRALRPDGLPELEEIGEKYGLTRERVT